MIVFVYNNKAHWLTPYQSLSEVPDHPSGDLYVEAPAETQAGWLYHPEDGTFTPPPPVFLRPPDVTNEAIAQMLSSLEARLLIKGVL